MTELLTSAQMRTIEHAAIESGVVTGLELMERAGRGVVEAVFEQWPELEAARVDRGAGPSGSPEYLQQNEKRRAVVLCGPGNNGGDGFVVARLLKERGWEVEVFLYGDAARLPPDARANYERWCALGDTVVRAVDPPALMDDSLQIDGDFDLLVDALFGTGLTRPFRGLFTIFAQADVNALLVEKGVRSVAVDMPSGLCSDSGRVLGNAIPADLTVSFQAAKLGHYLAQGASQSGRMRVVDIGLGAWLDDPLRAELLNAEPVGLIAARPREIGKGDGHKYSHGHALILSGGFGKTGATRLAARGALRIGAGVVTLGVPPAAQMEVAGHISALMQRRVADVDGLAEVLEDARINALCLGPGLGVERARCLVAAALGGTVPRATVLDADALTGFADAPEALFSMLHAGCVLTPHGGEFARLFPDIAAKLDAPATAGPAYSKVNACREAAARAGCVVLFKGPDTVIAAPDGRCSINAAVYDRAAPWLATAGSGDVLAGFIAGLLARGFDPMRAAEIGAWLHVECARSFGPGLIAEDLPEELPKVFRALGV